MTTLTVTSKGQITLRKELLQHLGVSPGQQLRVEKLANGVLSVSTTAALDLDAFVGCLPPPPRALSLAEMELLVEQSWAGRRT